MTTSYKADAFLNVRSNAPQALTQIARALGVLDTRIAQSQRNLSNLINGFAAFQGATQRVQGMAASMQGVQQATQGATAAALASARAMGVVSSAAARVAQAAQQATTALQQMNAVPGPRAPARIVSGSGGSRLGEVAALGGAARLGQQGLSRVFMDAGNLQNEQSILRGQTGRMRPDQGMTAEAFQAALLARAIETTRLVRGSTIAENLAAGAELRTILNGPRNAVDYLPRFQMIAHALARASGAAPDRMTASLGRALSLRGSFNDQMTGEPDAERGARELEMAGRMMFAFRGRGVNPEELEMFQRRARVMGERMAPEAYFGGWTASLIQNLTGNVAGTALNAFGRQIVNGIMTNPQAEFLRQHGLLASGAQGSRIPEREIAGMLSRGEIDPEEAARMRAGATSRFNRMQIVNSDLAAIRPDLYFEWLIRHLDSRGIRTQDERDAFANAVGGTNTARQLFSFGLNPAAIRPDIEAVRSVAPGALEQFLSEGFSASMTNLTGAITNLTTSLGSSSTGDVISAMDRVGKWFNDMGDWARANPEASTWLVNIGIGITGLATAGALFAAGTMAFGGLTALGTALGGLAAAAVVGGIAALVSPTGLALLGASIVGLAANMEGKDWAALFANLDGIFTRIGRYLGVTPGSRSETGSMPEYDAAGNPTGRMIPLPPTAPRPNNPWAPPGFSDPSGSGFQLQNFVPPGSGGAGGATPIILNLDGRRVGEGVLPHLNRELGGALRAATRFDSSLSLPSVMSA